MRLIKGIVFIIFLLALTAERAYPQDEVICSACKKPVEGRYLIVEGKAYHPEHFLCAGCGKPISGSFIKKEGKYFHKECYSAEAGLVCAQCGKAINGEYFIHDGKKYHRDCYENFVLDKCAVCGKPLKDVYTVDVYGNKFHSAHLKEMPKCDCCDRIISPFTTQGGKSLQDGRNICNICYKTAVYNQRDIERLLDLTAQRLIGMGINLDMNKIKVVGVDRSGLRNAALGYSDNMLGYCNSQSEKEYVNDKLKRKTVSHTIYVLNFLPSLGMESVLAHELMHAWLYENTNNNHPDRIKEGACNFVSYIYLKNAPSKSSADFLKKLENNPDPVYGGGLRELRGKFENRPVREFLSFLKEY